MIAARRQINWRTALGTVLCLVVFALPSLAAGPRAAKSDSTGTLPVWALLPFANHTGSATVHRTLAPLLDAELTRNGIRVLNNREIRPLLRAHRIRASHGVSPDQARLIADETGASALVMGSWDVLSEGTNPEVGFSLRVLDLETMRLVSAVHIGATGEDFRGLLGVGRVRLPEVVIWRALRRGVRELLRGPAIAHPDRDEVPCTRIALIPLDDYVQAIPAGEIMMNGLLASLVQGGYDVVEPGFVRDLLLARETAARGAIDLPASRALTEKFGVCLVLTGEVDRYSRATGDPATTAPSIALGLRAIDPRAGTIRSIWELSRTGADNDRILRLGRIHGVSSLTSTVLADWRDTFASTRR